jgi:amidase
LGALTGVDPEDAATLASRDKARRDYTGFLDPNGLKEARIGVARKFFHADSVARGVLERVLEDLKRLGATLIDFQDDLAAVGKAEEEVLYYEFKAGINEYLASLGPGAPMHNLEELIEFNQRNKSRELAFFGQENFLKSQGKGPLTDKAYLDALEKCSRKSRAEGIDAVMDKNRLDAIVAPSGGPGGTRDAIYGDRDVGGSSTPAAVAGYPNISVPAGDVMGLPVGISFFGRACGEPLLLKIAFAYEQGTRHRTPPRFLPTIGWP